MRIFGNEENFRFIFRIKKNRRGSFFENFFVEGRNVGYFSIGGVKVFIEVGIIFFDESENLDEEFDVCLELYFLS